MEQLSSQTEKISTYETSRTRLSLVDKNPSISNDEFEMDGFYVREKSDKVPNTNNDGTSQISAEVEDGVVENNIINPPEVENDDNSKDNLTEGIIDLNQEVDNCDKINKTEVNCDKTDELKEEQNDKKIDNSNTNKEVKRDECHNEDNVENVTDNTCEGETNDGNKETDNTQEHSCQTEDPMHNKEPSLTNGEIYDESDTSLKEKRDKSQNKSDLEIASKSIKNPNAEKLGDVDGNNTLNLEESVSNEGNVTTEEQPETIKDSGTTAKSWEKSVGSNEVKSNRVIIKRVLPKREGSRKTYRRVKRVKNKSETSSAKKSDRSSILKEHLERKGEVEETVSNDNDMDIDEDFDPSLLCPDISMDVDEALVITNSESNLDDDLPYEAVFSEMVDEITGAGVEFELTPKELELKQAMFGPNNPVQYTKVHCTACNLHLGSALSGANNRFVHPLLKVLICKNCYHFYTSGEFEKDEDGSELYCRWCGQGGQVLCCSSCEYVFCKRCIKNNFGQKKFKEIRDSDDWSCFRCDAPQLSYLRAACSEFMDYYRMEMARVRTLAEEQPELMTTDYTKCCNNAEPKLEEPKVATQSKLNKRKRKDSSDDPDYKPVADEEEIPTKMPKVSFTPMSSNANSKFRPLLPKITSVNSGVRQILLQPQSNVGQVQHRQVFRVGNTTFRAKSMASSSFAVRPGVVQGLNKQVLTAVRMPGKNPQPEPTTMKHEWFEKTVRAAARVNSNLSYTLTQLNRQQSQANNVEALAVVHNKLQEVLSSSINSLIQIRKNLRTEFIAGIKNVKFPPNTPTAAPIVVKDDDDVIIVNPSSTQPKSTSSPPPLIFPSGMSVLKPPEPKPFKPTPQKPGPSTIKNNAMGPMPKGGFLKVRSFSALQKVTSECITIPDDPPSKKTELSNVYSNNVKPSITNEELVIIDDPSPENGNDDKMACTPYDRFVYNVTERPTPEVQRMMDVIIKVKRSPLVDEIMKIRGLVKCSTSSDHS